MHWIDRRKQLSYKTRSRTSAHDADAAPLREPLLVQSNSVREVSALHVVAIDDAQEAREVRSSEIGIDKGGTLMLGARVSERTLLQIGALQIALREHGAQQDAALQICTFEIGAREVYVGQVESREVNV